MNSPNPTKFVVEKKVCAIPTPVLIAFPIVLPILSARPSVPMNPLIKVAMLLAILLQVSCIASQLMLSSPSRILVPTISPISLKSASFHASLTICAKLENLLLTSSVPNILPIEPPVPLLPELLSSDCLVISSKPYNSFLAAAAADAVLFRLPA